MENNMWIGDSLLKLNKRRVHQVQRLSRIIECLQEEGKSTRRMLDLRKDLRRQMGITLEVLIEGQFRDS